MPTADCRLPMVNKCLIAGVTPLAIGLVVGLVYWAGSFNNGFVYDDHEVIQTLSPLHSMRDVAAIFTQPHYLNYLYYRPITRLTFAWQRTIWGDNPRPYHVFNAILAGLVGIAAYLLLRQNRLGLNNAVGSALRTTNDDANAKTVRGADPTPIANRRSGVLAAMLAALWFALHPATSECVYPAASGRESLMPMLFILLATWAYLHERGRGIWLPC